MTNLKFLTKSQRLIELKIRRDCDSRVSRICEGCKRRGSLMRNVFPSGSASRFVWPARPVDSACYGAPLRRNKLRPISAWYSFFRSQALECRYSAGRLVSALPIPVNPLLRRPYMRLCVCVCVCACTSYIAVLPAVPWLFSTPWNSYGRNVRSAKNFRSQYKLRHGRSRGRSLG